LLAADTNPLTTSHRRVIGANKAGPLVVDLAYAPRVIRTTPPRLRPQPWQRPSLLAEQGLGLTAVVRVPHHARPINTIANLAPSWVIGRDAVALLESATECGAPSGSSRGSPVETLGAARLARCLSS